MTALDRYNDLVGMLDFAEQRQPRLVVMFDSCGRPIMHHTSPVQMREKPLVQELLQNREGAVEVLPSIRRIDLPVTGFIFLFDEFRFDDERCSILFGNLVSRSLENRLNTLDVQSRYYAGAL